MADPNEVPQEPQEEEQQEGQQGAYAEAMSQQQAPEVDLETAYDVISRAEGWDPRLAKYQVQELKERRAALEQREREIEAQRQQMASYRPPQPEFGDAATQYAYEAKMLAEENAKMFREFIEGNKKEREEKKFIDQLSTELDTAFTTVARQDGLSAPQMEERSKEFYRILTTIYPEPEMIRRIGSEQAVKNAYSVFRSSMRSTPAGGGYDPRNRRQQFVVPTQGSATSNGGPAPGPDFGPPHPGETPEQYHNRLKRSFQDAGFSASTLLPDKGRVSSA